MEEIREMIERRKENQSVLESPEKTKDIIRKTANNQRKTRLDAGDKLQSSTKQNL